MTIYITPTIFTLVLLIAIPLWVRTVLSLVRYYKDKRIRFYRGQLSELLATIHGDGGHHESKVGTAQAVEDALYKISKRVEFRNLPNEKQIGGLLATLNEIRNNVRYAYPEEAKENWAKFLTMITR